MSLRLAVGIALCPWAAGAQAAPSAKPAQDTGPFGGGRYAVMEMLLESHHLYDKIRVTEYATQNGMTAVQLNPSLPFTPAAGAPFGKGGTYGTTTCLPLPLAEKVNNPNIP